MTQPTCNTVLSTPPGGAVKPERPPGMPVYPAPNVVGRVAEFLVRQGGADPRLPARLAAIERLSAAQGWSGDALAAVLWRAVRPAAASRLGRLAPTLAGRI